MSEPSSVLSVKKMLWISSPYSWRLVSKLFEVRCDHNMDWISLLVRDALCVDFVLLNRCAAEWIQTSIDSIVHYLFDKYKPYLSP